MTVTVYSRTVNGKKGKWEFHSSYVDGMPGGKKREKEYGLFDESVWQDFAKNVYKSKNDLTTLLLDIKSKGQTVVGNSCPCRASVLINFCGIGKDILPYIAEQSTSAKLGLHMPGKHMPIIDNKILFEEQPDYVLLLAWHIAEPIIKDLRNRGLKSKFIIPLAAVKVLSAS